MATTRRAPLTARQYILLIATWLVGSLVATLGFVVVAVMQSGESLHAALVRGWQAPDPTPLVLILCVSLLALACIGGVCFIAYRRGCRAIHYPAAFCLGLAGYWLFTLLFAIMLALMGLSSVNGVVATIAAVCLMVGALGAMLNVFNLLVTVPAVIFTWYRILDGSGPEIEKHPWRSRVLLLLIALALIGTAGYVEKHNVRKHLAVTSVQFDLGGDVDDTLERSGIFDFEESATEDDALYFSRDFSIEKTVPVRFVRKGYEVQCADVVRVSFHAPLQAPRSRVRRISVKFSLSFGKYQQDHAQENAMRGRIEPLIAQFRRGHWRPVHPAPADPVGRQDQPDDDTSRAIDPDRLLSDEDWHALMQRRGPFHWSWTGEGIKATLRIIPTPPSFPGYEPNYETTLDFEDPHITEAMDRIDPILKPG